ncbi:aarf domain-containing kinase [Venturia nashicola]|uniref:Aarf domain-containing kinase n=1 Tax=Venturia nashicola TaxID=86259 RepID=A0A4Z1P3G4_9PEZI|nr:aarf domain-containing kinase [Venturia nashicola]
MLPGGTPSTDETRYSISQSMSGRRLLDAARLFNASRCVAIKHFKLRSLQLHVFTKTSTLVKVAKDQTGRITLTAQAAIAIARKLNEQAPSYPYSTSYPPPNQTASQHVPPTPHQASVPGSRERGDSGREHIEDTQAAHEKVDSRGINSDSYHSTERDREAAQPLDYSKSTAEEAVPADVDINVFRTSKVSKLLGLEPNRKRLPGPGPPGAVKTQAPIVQPPTQKHKTSEDDFESLAEDIAKDASAPPEPDRYQMRESRVPASRLGRLWEYSGLATSMAFGAVGEGLRRVTGGSAGGSLMLSAGNMERLVAKLSRMRGAALKLGQMISFQDIKMLPAPIHDVLQRVQDSADYMPASQRDRVLEDNLGENWRELFSRFDDIPIAAASIGQVHRAVLASTGQEVAVKVQYPGVAGSIDSDLNNLSVLLTASRLLPKGLYLDKTIANARTELGWECDYIREAECATRFKTLLEDETETFTVPAIIPEASGKTVLTADMLHGVGVTKLKNLNQDTKDWIGTQVLRLCLREICEFQFMQTDPNWTNFLYNSQTETLELLDFGASREFPLEFVTLYIGILKAASENDRAAIRNLSVQLGYLTGSESNAMLNAHIDSVLTLAEPFRDDGPEVYDFEDQTITDRVRNLIPVMIKERMAPPPEETYSLHRKLSGAFLMCAKLGSKVRCKEMFRKAVGGFEERYPAEMAKIKGLRRMCE